MLLMWRFNIYLITLILKIFSLEDKLPLNLLKLYVYCKIYQLQNKPGILRDMIMDDKLKSTPNFDNFIDQSYWSKGLDNVILYHPY